ncbi:iron chelate uptake ABC transporter family permease subunit [Vibrio aphrogenes]|uniref:iron chelate uptake ABC transporter family permease subunit n=1 Tax=Vibrio aphrogenes TaxID=1891186 RepID=UPI000B35110A|nr:iron chelate uptake ABC transporter family permease subunit [Vibrio aphrogenes]
MDKTLRSPQIKLIIFIILLAGLGVAGLMIGAMQVPLSQIGHTLLFGGEFDFIVNQYRLPRVVLAIGVGAGLGLSGMLVQGVIRNPLASPDLMGISAGAGLAATSLLILYPEAPLYTLSLSALAGGLGAALLILIMAYKINPTPSHLALIGISVSVFFASCIDFLLIVNPVEINTAMVWLTGSLWGRSWEQVPYIGGILLVMLPFSLWLAWRLDVMGLGEEAASSLGVQPKRLQGMALFSAVVLASISISVCGTISFVGLLAPHLSRMVFGHHHKFLVPSSAIFGALMVLISDILARGVQPPLELPAGVLTSLIGAPYFIFLLQRYKGWS